MEYEKTIHDLRQRVADAEARAERLQSAVDNIIDGIITIDDSRMVQYFNRRAEEIFGYSAHDIVGCNVNRLTSEPFYSEHDPYSVKTGEKRILGVGREVVGRRKDGTTFLMDLAVSEFRLGGQRMFTGVVRDITERKQLEEQLIQSQKMESVGQLAGGIAHDFNNQLSIILFDLDMMLEDVLEDGSIKEGLLGIRKVALRSADLTRQLLLFSRRQPMDKQAIDMNQHVDNLRRMLGRVLGEQVRIRYDLEEKVLKIKADPTSLDQIITNLSINARDAMSQGGALNITTRNVDVDRAHCQREPRANAGRHVCLSVEDTGIGMDEEVQARLFEPFFTTKGPGKGTGLGLAVVYGIVEAHKGWITVASKPDQGARFDIYFPALLKETQADDASTGKVGGATIGRDCVRHILLLEDEPDVQKRMCRVLTQKGYVVYACYTLAQAREVFERESDTLDLVISDVVLPDGKGPDLVLQFLAKRADLAVILTSGYTDAADSECIKDLGMPLLLKPFPVADLLNQVQEVLQTERR